MVRDEPEQPQPAASFFDETFQGAHCETDWYEGSVFAHGRFRNGEAPALLGFDDDIHDFCNNNCDEANVNILNLFSRRLKYNMCRNFEWQVCAARGALRGQNSQRVRFAVGLVRVALADDELNPELGVCSGWTDVGCDTGWGFANDVCCKPPL